MQTHAPPRIDSLKEMQTPEPENPQTGGPVQFKRTILLTLVIGLVLPTGAHLQTDTGSPQKTDRSTHRDINESNDRTRKNERDGPFGGEPVGHTPLKNDKQNINELLDSQSYGRALENARTIRCEMDGTDRSDASTDYYHSVLKRIEDAYEEVRDRTGEMVRQDQPYRAYRYLNNRIPDFSACAPYHRRLRRLLRRMKSDVVEAYRKGELVKRPDVSLEIDNGSSDRMNTDREETEEESEENKQQDAKPIPAINASEPSMSNAPDSPKAFDGKVVNTTDSGVHFEIDFQGADSRQKMGYFLFELRGLKGREKVRIDLTNMGRWSNSKTITPMFSYGVDRLDDLTMLKSEAPEDGHVKHVKTGHGQIVPRTKGRQKWHYFRNVTVNEDTHTLTVRKRFPKEMNHTYIAHRVPYPHSYHKNYMEKLKERARYGDGGLTVHDVGTSQNGRPLHLVELENPTDPKATKKPVVLFTSGEHPDEHATYQAMKGTMRYLMSDDRRARALRRRATFLFVPVLDPDGLVRNMYENICYTFIGDSRFLPEGPSQPSQTARAYARWFRQWANRGRRLDVHLLTHCVESGETASHLFNYLVEPDSGRRKTNLQLWKTVRQGIRDAGYRVDDEPSGQGYTSNRIGGFLEKNFRTMQLFVELNSQPRAPGRNLTLSELRMLGVEMVRSTVQFLYSDDARSLYQSIKQKRTKRRQLVNRYEPFLQSFDQARHPFARESWLKLLPSYERIYLNWRKKRDRVSWVPQCKRWFEQLYKQYDVSPNTVPQ